MVTMDTTERTSPPYVAYQTFKNFLETLKASGLPSRIDKSVMTTLSGGTQSQLIVALRWLGLIGGPNDVPSPDFPPLVDAATTDKWADNLAQLIKSTYADVLDELDLTSATPSQVHEEFKKTGADGATATKAVRFFLHAVKDAKIDHSSRLLQRKPRGPRRNGGGRQRSERAAVDSVRTPAPPPTRDADEQMIEFPIYFRGKSTGLLIVPESVTPEDCAMLGLAVKMVETYAAQNATT
jgi:hypothetical protein